MPPEEQVLTTAEGEQPSGNVISTDTPAETSQEAVSSTDDNSEQQDLARQRGWVEQEKWKGKGWVDAVAYNDRYEHVMPVVARENKRLRAEMQERDATLNAVQAELADIKKFQQETTEARQKIDHDMLLADRARALEEQDYQKVVTIDDKLMGMKVAAAAPKPQPQQKINPAIQRVLDDFVGDNPLFKDAKLQSVLTEQTILMATAGTTLRGRELLDEAKERVERMYPERFRPAKRPAMAETNGAPGNASANGKTWADLTVENRTALDAFINSEPQYVKMGVEKARARLLALAPASHFKQR